MACSSKRKKSGLEVKPQILGNPILWIIVLVVLLIAFLMIRYRIGKPDEALIVTGSFLGKEGIKASSGYLIP